jgi:16S rRNA (cytidine1402-2'-O)-methyltransferase
MAGTLFVVATPIGHLEDISARALRVLREVSVVAAEDTRRTSQLLRHFGIPTRLISLHEHNERTRGSQLVDQLARGESVAVVSDAGTPGISDPGAEVVRLVRARGLRVEAIPGPSAVAAAVSVAGLEEGDFAFLGFPPVRSKDRNLWFQRAERLHQDIALVFFEAPHRIRRTLEDLAFLDDQSIILFRELTKLHEETLSGPPAVLAASLEAPRGEFTIIVPRQKAIQNQQLAPTALEISELIGQITESGASTKRAAARELGRKFGLSTRQVYELARKPSA